MLQMFKSRLSGLFVMAALGAVCALPAPASALPAVTADVAIAQSEAQATGVQYRRYYGQRRYYGERRYYGRRPGYYPRGGGFGFGFVAPRQRFYNGGPGYGRGYGYRYRDRENGFYGNRGYGY